MTDAVAGPSRLVKPPKDLLDAQGTTIRKSAFRAVERPSILPEHLTKRTSSFFLPPQIEVSPMIELEKKPYNPVDIYGLPSSHDLFNQYDAFNSNKALLFETSDKILSRYNQMCPRYYSTINDLDKYEGFAEEISIPTDTSLVIKADIHGNWIMFKLYIEKLISEEYLDDNLRCKEGVHITFLGDFTGRNNSDLFITAIIAMMKLQQPEQIHILKGNHEEKSFIDQAKDPSSLVYEYFSSSDERKNMINSFSDNLPIIIIFHEKNYERYVSCVHGVVDPTVNLKQLIRDPKTNILFIPKLTLENFLSYREKISLYDPNDDSTFSRELWAELFQKRAKYFFPNPSTPSLQHHKSSFTWGTILPITSTDTFDNTPPRYAGDIACSYRTLKELADLYSICSMYFGHAHSHQEYLREGPNQLQVKVLTCEAYDAFYEIDAAVVTFNSGEIREFTIQKPEAKLI